MNIFLALQITAEAIKAPVMESSVPTWVPIVGAFLTPLIVGLFGWWKTRPKNKSDQFQTFMDESSEFRDEMRKERESLKLELMATQAEKKLLLDKIANLESDLRKSVLLLEDANKKVDDLKLKVNSLKERVVGLNG